MLNAKPPFTKRELYKAARDIRHQKVAMNGVPDGLGKPEWDEILNNCWYVNRDIRDFITYHWLDSESLKQCVDGWENTDACYHYIDVVWCVVTDWDQETTQDHAVLVIDSDIVHDDLATTGYVIVDGALDQFHDDNYESGDVPFSLGQTVIDVSSVVVAPPKSKYRKQIYHEYPVSDPPSPFSPSLPI